MCFLKTSTYFILLYEHFLFLLIHFLKTFPATKKRSRQHGYCYGANCYGKGVGRGVDEHD